MVSKLVERILDNLAELEAQIGDKDIKRLDLKLLKRAINRLGTFLPCEECEKYLVELDQHIEELKNNQGQFEKLDFKYHRLKVNNAVSHLQKEHNLVTEGYYISIYMSLGISLGLPFGLLLFDNIALGLPIGLSIGLAIGSAMDADAKKKGRTI